jgi:hypothetical protein
VRRIPLMLTWPSVAILAGCGGQAPSQAPAPTTRVPVAADAPLPTAAMSAAELRRYLTVFAADSLAGRQMGTVGNVKATDYLATQLRSLGVEPAGEHGSYFQTLTLTERAVDSAASGLSLHGKALVIWQDYAPIPPFPDYGLPFGIEGSLDGAPAIYAGALGDTTGLSPEQATGKLVVVGPPRGPTGPAGLGAALERYGTAAGIAFAMLDFTPPAQLDFLREPPPSMRATLPKGPLGLLVRLATVGAVFGVPVDSIAALTPGRTGAAMQGTIRFALRPTAIPSRNVIAVVRGSDPALRNEYVVIGAHSDHIGVRDVPLDHDSVWAFNHVVRPEGAESPMREATAEEQSRISAIRDSLRALHPSSPDSIFNGADDDGSGSVTALAMAAAFQLTPAKPRRSILFVWHTGEEAGLYGSRYFTDDPTVPRDSIVAELNMDMVGRGGATDVKGGGPGYLQLIGSRRLSTELGDLVETVNTRGGYGFTFDYQFDAPGHPQQYYCRSDHYMYARYGIPIVFFSTGSHQDYHQLTDEVQYIDFDKMARVGRLVMDIARTVANLDHRVVVDHPKPDPNGQCRQ